MTQSTTDLLRAEVTALLERNGYVEVPSRVSIRDIDLEVPDLWEGPAGSLDLSLIADRPASRETSLRLFWLVQRLIRALDAASSRRTVTIILISERASSHPMSDLSELARVLVVDGSLPTERMLAPILRLHLPNTATAKLDGVAEVALAISQRRVPRTLHWLVEGASEGATVVSDRYRAWIEESFTSQRNANA